jgi:hypothetical protein
MSFLALRDSAIMRKGKSEKEKRQEFLAGPVLARMGSEGPARPQGESTERFSLLLVWKYRMLLAGAHEAG